MIRASIEGGHGDPPVPGALARPRLSAVSNSKEIGEKPSGSLGKASSPIGVGTSGPSGPAAFAGSASSSWGRRKSAPAVLRDIFTPTRPKQGAAFFSGRGKQLARIITGIEEQRAHIMLYGERGSGKTSLANVVAEKAEAAGYLVLRFVCSADVGFDDIFSSFLHRIPAGVAARGISVSRAKKLAESEAGNWSMQELLQIFDSFAPQHFLLMIDEYDRVTSETTKERLAELMKILSDAAAPVTLFIIGVAESVSELLGKHPSLQRAVMVVPLPLMTPDEIDGIIAVGEEKSGLRFEPDVRRCIIDFTQGLPCHAQLLCYFAALSAHWRNSGLINSKDLRYAIQRVADEAQPDIRLTYDCAIRSNGKTSFRDALFLAALCPTDEFGTFRAADAAVAAGATPSVSLLTLQRAFKKLSGPDRGAVLRHIPTSGGIRYRFASQMLRHHVLCREAEERRLVRS